mmetsp:Transcript_48459/g.58664  ORF Transcript_48459/g.58664 Transcript_48459/m.58664 type:complete len:237 (+) Transcript_48459:35-745(+)|eukprot:CAMPEP_0172500146 /NCGR_PEP_ID=MMETSP1066-20121228/135091_1 /TAXON_ID=671091 /ORGANISM="Coscinodiscus wailesii, Strain CCMP2513" /LENGTH=236 /DNA_ID=CAMNT_0013274233 /DNA_START=33 /DNA_END=743 /DNA_ORIENTATION=-
MSLSFVSSAILSSSDGVSHNEEKVIDSQEAKTVREQQKHSTNGTLFDQLRANRDLEQEKYDEIGKQMRMGVRPLDEDDCAHLDKIKANQLERKRQRQGEEEEAIAMFKASKAERQIKSLGQEETRVAPQPAATEKKNERGDELKTSTIIPVILGKKRRKEYFPSSLSDENGDKLNNNSLKKPKTNDNTSLEKSEILTNTGNGRSSSSKEKVHDNSNHNGTGLNGLLGCYGSDSESD